MSSTLDPGDVPCLIANPDVSGIGVRVSIYVQNLLSFVPAILALTDGKVTPTELDALEAQSKTILITAFAVLVTTIVQASTTGLSNWHATVVLNLSMMNNTTLFIYLLLYLYQRTSIPSDLDALSREKPKKHIRDFIHLVVTNSVVNLGAIHLSLMAAVGIWLWSDPARFGNSGQCSLSATLVIIGKEVPIGSRPLRIFFLVLFSSLLLPILHNITFPALLFLALIYLLPPYSYLKPIKIKAYHIRFGLGVLAIIDIILLVDIEVGIRRNIERGLLGDDDSVWTFGQILALLLLLLPLRDVWEALSGRQAKVHGQRLKKASEEGKLDVVIEVLGFGPIQADIDQALCVAAKNCHWDVIKHLIESGANIQYKNYRGMTALHHAAQSGSLELVQWLVETYNFDVHSQDNYKTTLVHYSAQSGSLELIQWLVNKCHASATEQDEYKKTPLHYGASSGSVELVQWLVEVCKAEVNIQDRDKTTPLHYAAQSKNFELVQWLIEMGGVTDVNVHDKLNKAPVHYAVENGSFEIVRYLIENFDASLYRKDNDDWTPLHYAAKIGNSQLVSYLFERCNADVNAKAKSGNTPLHYAIRYGKLEVVKYLVEEGKADMTIKDNTWVTPLGVAKQIGHEDIIKYLKQAMHTAKM